MTIREQVLEELWRYMEVFPAEIPRIAPLIEQLATDARDVMSRANMLGHVTTSAFVLDAAAQKALLIHHRVLDCWMQPGGHYEDREGELRAAALREVIEETGAHGPQLHPWSIRNGCTIDIDTHPIAERAGGRELAHRHHDFTYLVTADSRLPLSAQLEEVLDARWMPLPEVATLGHPRLTRLLEKLGALDLDPRPDPS